MMTMITELREVYAIEQAYKRICRFGSQVATEEGRRGMKTSVSLHGIYSGVAAEQGTEHARLYA